MPEIILSSSPVLHKNALLSIEKNQNYTLNNKQTKQLKIDNYMNNT
ncbi:11900_t:CDS:2 [Entrophospora sp. SA101]|nr:11900_t:CDS:2 [Entrophospora sp. SA101]